MATNIVASTWIDKYKPNKISDLTTNSPAVKAISLFLTSFNKVRNDAFKSLNGQAAKTEKIVLEDGTVKRGKKITYKSCLFIVGNHGTGKSVTVSVIAKELGYDIHHVDINMLKSTINIEDTLKKLLRQTNIVKLLEPEGQTKHVLIVDELEAFVATNEKAALIMLQKLNDLNWYCPLIFISNGQHNKLAIDIKKGSIEVKMWPPYDSEIEKILLRICQNEKIQIKHKSVANKIIRHSQYDIRRLIYTLEDIKNAYGSDTIISPDLIEEYCSKSSIKDVDIDLYKASNELLYEYKNVDDCLRLFETEKVLLPLMVQQNYIGTVLGNLKQEKKRQVVIKKISDLLSTGDVIENYIYGDQCWDLEDIHGFYTCAATSYYLLESMSVGNKSKVKPKLTFAVDLNKTSIKRINKKNIINADKCFSNMNIEDYIYMSKLVKHFIESDQIDRCVKLMKNYGAKLEHIESILKIDKIENSKNSLTTKQKSEFIKCFANPE
ncbi:MAG: replication factor C large subunit [Barrevirus sp.]|uniref:Replication factor C large subunit n=1 Tax=Barrevirus sp. TaxID=2487763 RepID=A0A3G4ZQP9_9VIRU|nr:MAG: replication factor C large subunit [Barrevirus sp.]